MSEVLKVPNTVLLIKDQRACQRCRRCETLYSNTNKGSKGYVCRRCRKWCLWLLHNTANRVLLLISEVSKVIVLCIQWPLAPARGEGYCVSLFSWGLDLSTTRVIAGKTHSQSPILKTKGALSNLVILTYLWEQSCILHTLTKTACL